MACQMIQWTKLKDKKPEEKQTVEFPADKKRDGIIKGYFSEGNFWSQHDGYHEPKKWRPCQNDD